MSATWRLDSRFAARLVAAFAVWSAAGLWLLPVWAGVVAPVAGALLQALHPHDTAIAVLGAAPRVVWRAAVQGREWEGSLSAGLLTHNLVLYAALLSAPAGLGARQRLRLALTGLPVLFALHVVDLLLAVESDLLTHLQPGSYRFWEDFSVWFVAVKYYGSLSALALRQVVPLALLLAQVRLLRMGQTPAPSPDGSGVRGETPRR